MQGTQSSRLAYNPIMMTRRLSLVVPTFVCSLALACGSSDSSSNGSVNPGTDAGSDAQLEAAPDVANDSALEASPDVTADAIEDVAPDAGQDATPDAPVEAAPDAPVEASPDAQTDAGDPWPTCDAQPAGVPDMTLPEIWTADPSTPTEVWITGLYVTAISWGGCSSGNACQIFLQDAETYGSFAAGAHHGMKLFVSGATSEHFETLQVGDRVNVYAHAWRYNVNPAQNELLLQVNGTLRGCAKTVGSGTPSPIEGVELTDLTVDAYENTHGPLLVKIDGVSGKPGPTSETFALWKTGGPYTEAGVETVVSASPYFLSGGNFSGLPIDGTTTVDFASITGVSGLFVPSTADGGTALKYLMLYPRTMGELPTL